MSSQWTKESEEFVVSEYQAGSTASEIASALGRRFHICVSRSAVIGKIHRLLERAKLERRSEPAKPKLPKAVKVEAPPPPPAKKPTNPPPLKHFPKVQTQPSVKGVPQGPLTYDIHERATSDSVDLMNLQSHHCRFPLEDDRNRTFFCGKAKLDGSSYCPEHHARCNFKQPHVSRLFATRKSRRFEGGRLGF